MKKNVSTITEIQRLLDDMKLRAAQNPTLEVELAKKLGIAAEALSEKDSVTKDLSQAFNHGESWWARNAMNGELEGCNKANKLEKIKLHVLRSSSYSRHINSDATRAKADKWVQDRFASVGSDEQETA